MSKLHIEIEAFNEEGLCTLLKHVYKEITDCNYYNYDIENNCKPIKDWLVIEDGSRYRWRKV